MSYRREAVFLCLKSPFAISFHPILAAEHRHNRNFPIIPYRLPHVLVARYCLLVVQASAQSRDAFYFQIVEREIKTQA